MWFILFKVFFLWLKIAEVIYSEYFVVVEAVLKEERFLKEDVFFTLSIFFLYLGGRQADDIVQWLSKKTGPAAKDLKSVEEAKELIDSNNVVIIGFFKDQSSDSAKQFLAAASDIDDHPFGITSDEAIFKEYEAECGSIILFKKVIFLYLHIYNTKITWFCV